MNIHRITSIELLNKTPFLNLYKVLYKNKKDTIRNWIVASRKKEDEYKNTLLKISDSKDDAVVIAAFHKKYKKLVIIKEYRVPINDYIYELVAGLVEPNEESLSASSREFKEETGLNLVKILKSKENIYASAGMTDESFKLIYCTCDGEISTDFQEDDEDIETLLIDKNEALSILNSNNKIDVKAYFVLKEFACVGEKMFIE
ncbi:NUDIX hydrolase [Clostridium sp. BJN0001]|uniref:NUDIX hydrolase n=1 Tax=Clostridium sp. BJN0001 TaxID=2930219 RepID=UPI001FD187D9|nr:NUDIX hydrolase [Clostridium sp. BJN0001]